MCKAKWVPLKEATQYLKRENGVLTNIPFFNNIKIMDSEVYGELVGYLDEFGNKVIIEDESTLLH